MYHIYRFKDNEDIVYVGITNSVDARVSAHRASSKWCMKYMTVEYVTFPNRAVAKMYETYLINTLMPKNNIAEKNSDDLSLVSFSESEFEWLVYRKNKGTVVKEHREEVKLTAQQLEWGEKRQAQRVKTLAFIRQHKSYLLRKTLTEEKIIIRFDHKVASMKESDIELYYTAGDSVLTSRICAKSNEWIEATFNIDHHYDAQESDYEEYQLWKNKLIVAITHL